MLVLSQLSAWYCSCKGMANHDTQHSSAVGCTDAALFLLERACWSETLRTTECSLLDPYALFAHGPSRLYIMQLRGLLHIHIQSATARGKSLDKGIRRECSLHRGNFFFFSLSLFMSACNSTRREAATSCIVAIARCNQPEKKSSQQKEEECSLC